MARCNGCRRAAWSGHASPAPGVELRPESDLALYREIHARLESLLASTDAPDLAARASAATAS